MMFVLVVFFIVCEQFVKSFQFGVLIGDIVNKVVIEGYEVIYIENFFVQCLVKCNVEGVIIEEGMFYDGKKIGVWIEYGLEGKFLAKFIIYVDGNYNGIYLEFNIWGYIILRVIYKNNKLDGLWVVYSFGWVEKQVNYKNGEFDGIYFEYNKKIGDL